jgi:TetR/AcrR family transcriptional regulator, cholesterol catabolism regulator
MIEPGSRALARKSEVKAKRDTVPPTRSTKQSLKRSRPKLVLAETNTSLRKSDVTRQRILAAAARVFRDHGYAGTRLTDIAAEAGMKAGSMYYHFDSREALVEEVIIVGTRRTHEAGLDRLRALPADALPLDKLAVLIESHLLAVLQQGDITSATIQLIWQVPAEIRERTLAVQRAYGALWRTVLEEARAAGAIRPDLHLSAIRMSILGALNWAADWYHPAGASPKSIARDIVTMVLHGLSTEERCAPIKISERKTKRRSRENV